jgi:hypothetical protein
MSQISSPAPITLFVYNRLDLTRQTLESLAANPLASHSDLIVFSDGAKTREEAAKVDEVRGFIAGFKGFQKLLLIRANQNRGLGNAIVEGVTRVVGERGRTIVMEDDLITSPFFLEYMNDALLRYAEEDRVAAVSGYLPPVDTKLPETFFLRDAECWGWATWQRAWSLFQADGALLLNDLRRRHLTYAFDQEGTYRFVRMLEEQIAGLNSSWAVRWRASVILNDRLSLYPGRSMVNNIGFDGSGTHCNTSNIWSVETSKTPIRVSEQPFDHCVRAMDAIKRFNRRNFDYGLMDRIVRKLKHVVRA